MAYGIRLKVEVTIQLHSTFFNLGVLKKQIPKLKMQNL